MITVSIRKEDGSIITMNRMSSSYNYSLFFTPQFSQCRFDNAINDYVESMVNNKENFTSLSPKNKGIVFIDFKCKEIHSIDQYHFPGRLLLADLFSPDINDIPHYDYLKKLYHDEKLYFCHSDNKQFTKLHQFLHNEAELSALKALEMDTREIPVTKTILYLETFTDNILKSWNVTSYKTNPENLILFLKMLISKNIVLNISELTEWKKYIDTQAGRYPHIPYSSEYINQLIRHKEKKRIIITAKKYTNPMGM